MKLDFLIKNKVIIDMESYVQEMVRDLRTHLKDKVICQWNRQTAQHRQQIQVS